MAVGQLPCCVPSTSPQFPLPIFTVALPPFPAVVRPFAQKVGGPWSCRSSAWEHLNSISDGLWEEWSLLAETGQGCRGGTPQRKGWRVCGWSPKAHQRRRKPVVSWNMSEEKKACSLMDSFIIPAPAGWLIFSPGSSQHNKEGLYIQNLFFFFKLKTTVSHPHEKIREDHVIVMTS